MFKLITVGLVGAIAASAGAAMANVGWLSGAATPEGEGAESKVETVATELTAVPVISGGKVTGYLVLRVSSSVDMAKLKHPEIGPGPYLSDAVFRAVFDFAAGGVPEIKAKDVEHLSSEIKRNAESHLGKDTVEDVRLEQFNLVSASEIRDKMIKSQ